MRPTSDVRSSSFDGTVDASAFAAGAAAFARRWEENAEKNENESGGGESDRVTARWVAEPDPLVRRRVAPGYLALEGALVECVSDVFEKDTADTADDSEGALFEDAAEEDDLADLASAATRGADVPASGKEETKTTRKTTLLFSYHAVYSPSYRAPVLVARARFAEPPRATTEPFHAVATRDGALRWLVAAACIQVMAGFFGFFAPLMYGTPLSQDALNMRFWLKGWE